MNKNTVFIGSANVAYDLLNPTWYTNIEVTLSQPLTENERMTDTITKLTQMDDWVFEVKMVRALKVKKHGDPYSAVANLTATGESVYIDTQLTKDGEELSKKDYMTIYKFCQALGMKEINYDRIKNGNRRVQSIVIEENQQRKPQLRIVK